MEIEQFEILEQAFEKPVGFKVADQMKFLKMIDPTVNKTLALKTTYAVNAEFVLITATINAADEVVFKLKGKFIFAD